MTRRPTAPIPAHLVRLFYELAWDIADDGGYVDQCNEVHYRRYPYTARRHALAALWMTACATRFSELRRLRVTDVSAAGSWAFITRSKGGMSGRIEVMKLLMELTFAWRCENKAVFNSQWLIPARNGNQLSNNAFNRDACGMFFDVTRLKLTSHCFRDTACQLAILQSGSVKVAQRLLGHKYASTTDHYIGKQQAGAFQVAIPEKAVAS